MSKAWAVLPMLIALLCVVGAVYIIMHERRRQTIDIEPLPPAPPSLSHPPAFSPRQPVTVASTRQRVTPTPLPSSPPPVRAPASRFELMQRDAAAGEEVLLKPLPQIRSPLIISHDLQYTRRHRKYTFQSDQRDQAQYPSASSYRLQLLVPLRNVVAITLSTGVFPISEPNVNVYNQWLDIDVGGTVYAVAVPPGDYSPTTIAGAIAAAITAVPALAGFTVTLDPLTLKLTVANAAPFSLLFRSGVHVNESLWKVMGFLQKDTPVGVSVVGNGAIDLAGALAIDMFIGEISDNIDSTDNAVARIDLQKFTPASTLTYFSPTDNGVPRYFWPIGRLQYLTFQFMVKWSELLPNGTRMVRYRPYLFEGRNHTMQLTISCQEYESPLEQTIELDPQS